jgi:hypothetical protein
MEQPALAIDFGTSRTKVAYFDEASGRAQLVEIGREIRTVLPSVFYIPKEGQGERLVGDDAQDMVDSDPEGIVLSLKKQLHKLGKKRCGPDRPAVDRIQLASDLFSHIHQRCRTEVFHGAEIIRCQITVPVDFKAQQRESIREAAKLGGFQEITLIEESIAAAQYWLRSHPDEKFGNSVIVCDVGGGTTDFAFLRYLDGRFQADDQVLSAGFSLGGNDLDEDIWERTTGSDPNRGQYDNQTPGFLVKIRRERELISKTQKSDIRFVVHGLECTIPRSTFEAVTAEFVERVKSEAARFLEKVSCQAKTTNAPILLVGGASKLPGLRDALISLNRGEVFLWNDCDYATVLGAVDVPVIPPASERAGVSASFRDFQQWYYSENDQRKGPISEEELKAKFANIELPRHALVWTEGMEAWTPASLVDTFSASIPKQYETALGTNSKSDDRTSTLGFSESETQKFLLTIKDIKDPVEAAEFVPLNVKMRPVVGGISEQNYDQHLNSLNAISQTASQALAALRYLNSSNVDPLAKEFEKICEARISAQVEYLQRRIELVSKARYLFNKYPFWKANWKCFWSSYYKSSNDAGRLDAEFESDQAEWKELDTIANTLEREFSNEMSRIFGMGEILISQLQAKYPKW